MITEKITKKIKKEISSLDEMPITFFLVNSSQYLSVNISILKELTVKDSSGIYVTLNRPFTSLLDMFKNGKIPMDSIFFIDCITKTVGKVDESKNVFYAESPQNLTKLSLIIEEAGKALPTKKKFIVLDALTTLTIYNSSGTVSKFLHFLTNKMRILGLSCILMSLEKELETEIKEQVEQFVDNVINLCD